MPPATTDLTDEGNDSARLSPTGFAAVPLLVRSPTPSWPAVFQPQHSTFPSSRSTQLCPPPTESATARCPVELRGTDTGSFWSTVLPMPIWPDEFAPQHFTWPV